MNYYIKKISRHMADNHTVAEVGNNHVIIIILAGNGTVSVGDQSYNTQSGSVVVAERGQAAAWHAAPGHALHIMTIAFSEKQDWREEAENEGEFTARWPFEKGTGHRLTRQRLQMAIDLERDWLNSAEEKILDKKGDPVGQDMQFGLPERFHALLSKLFGLHGKKSQPVAPFWVDEALQFIREHYLQPLTRKQLAQHTGVSLEHFSREFKKYSGKTFKAYVTELRIRKAQEELLSSSSNLEEIAVRVGYQDGFYLSRKFKQFVGAAPTIYLKRPKKIASLTYNYSASLLTLGVVPSVAVISSWTFHHFRGVIDRQKLQCHDNVPLSLYDTIRPSSPDLILDYCLDEERASELRAIAPLICLPFEELPWDEQFRYIARLVDKGMEAEDCLERLKSLIGQSNRVLDRELGKRGTAVVMELGVDKCYVFGDKWGRGTHVLYNPLQFAPPEALLQNGQCRVGYVEARLDTLRNYSADHIFFILPENAAERASVLAFMETEAWSSLAAVKNKQVYRIETGVFYGFDPASTKQQLTDMMSLLTKGQVSM